MNKSFFAPAGEGSGGGARVLDLPFIDQREKWPTGCESVSAVMVLRHMGVDVTVDEFIDDHLPKGDAPHLNGEGRTVGSDPRRVFPGDPRSPDGWGCYVPVLREAVDSLAEAKGYKLSTVDLSGARLEDLVKNYVNQGVPVLLWATIDMAEPKRIIPFTIEDTGETFLWVSPQHCLVLVGESEDGYCFNDPMAGKAVFYGKDAVRRAYEGLHTQAMIIVRDSE